MTIIEGNGWKLRWGLYWTWPHGVKRESAGFQGYYFGPFVLELSLEFLTSHDILGEDEDQGWIPLFILFAISLVAYLVSQILGVSW